LQKHYKYNDRGGILEPTYDLVNSRNYKRRNKQVDNQLAKDVNV